MNDFMNGGFGRRSGDFGHGSGIWEAMEQFRSSFGPRSSTRMNRGDVRAGVLALLAESPMHGYQIIQEIEERSGGAWKPSPGSVYPTLQLLTDEGLITAETSNGRKTYSLTEAGREMVDADAERRAPWESMGGHESSRASDLAKAGIELAQAAAQVGRTGSSDQVKRAVDVLQDARRQIYSILAQD